MNYLPYCQKCHGTGRYKVPILPKLMLPVATSGIYPDGMQIESIEIQCTCYIEQEWINMLEYHDNLKKQVERARIFFNKSIEALNKRLSVLDEVIPIEYDKYLLEKKNYINLKRKLEIFEQTHPVLKSV
jgi:hypothetical protein